MAGRTAAVIAGVLLVAPLMACAGGASNVSGEVLVEWGQGRHLGGSGNGGMDCSTSGGYTDIKEGAEVLVLNGEGNPVGKGRLGDGKTSDDDLGVCVFPFTVSNTNLKGDFFTVKVANREGPTYTKDEIKEPLSLSLLG